MKKKAFATVTGLVIFGQSTVSNPTLAMENKTPKPKDSSDTEQTVKTEESSTGQSEYSIVMKASESTSASGMTETTTTSESTEFSTVSLTPVEEDEQTVNNFIDLIGDKAKKLGEENGLYASVMIAQAIIESEAGQRELSQAPYFNLFGIKGAYQGSSMTMTTTEDDGTGNLYTTEATYRKYENYSQSFDDYVQLIKNGISTNSTIYQSAWKSHAPTYQDATKALTGIYSTDIHYGEKLNMLIEKYDLTAYDVGEAVPEELPSTETGTLTPPSPGIIMGVSHPDSDFPVYSGEQYPGSSAYAAGNCTQYVYNRVLQLGGVIDMYMGNGKDWGRSGIVKGYQVTRTPQAGRAVSFPPGVAGADWTYGHVAFVEHVYVDGSILISEMNVVGQGVMSFRVIDGATASGLSYITPKK